jgi:hypothetical protein
MALLFKERIPVNREAFAAKVIQISALLKLRSPDDLMAVMYSESGLDSTIQNTKYPVGGYPATGLIQIIQSTAVALGTTVAKLKAMSNVQQLDYVYKYYTQPEFKNKTFRNYTDLYLATFFPVAIDQPDSYILQTNAIKASALAKSNPIFDLNKDLQITVGEVKKAMLLRLQKISGNTEALKSFVVVNKTPIAGIILIATGIYLVHKYYKK